ncbi:hypothetical protein [Aestuariivirga sp.]|uniref:hypothetical protein n=1 Tax=Aestuariivirga sp. TaxID=2650926 RepID=UPI00391ACBEB
MDTLECCRKVEECLVRARRAETRGERLHWYELAAAWIDCCDIPRPRSRARRQRAGEWQPSLDC